MTRDVTHQAKEEIIMKWNIMIFQGDTIVYSERKWIRTICGSSDIATELNSIRKRTIRYDAKFTVD